MLVARVDEVAHGGIEHARDAADLAQEASPPHQDQPVSAVVLLRLASAHAVVARHVGDRYAVPG